MRILHFLSHSAIRGGQAVVASLVRSVKELQQEVTSGVVLPPGGDYVQRFKDLGVDTFVLPLGRMVLASSSIGDVLRHFAPNIIHTHERMAGWHVRRRSFHDVSARIIHSFHGFYVPPRGLRRSGTIAVENFLAAHTDGFICVSESEGNEVHRSIGNARGKIHVIGNTIDPSETRLKAEAPLPADLRAWFDANKTRNIITMVARAVPIKNHDLAFQAAATVLMERNSYAFLFLGIPPSDQRIRRLQRRFGNSVQAVEGLPTAAPVISRSWMLLLPSHREGSPLVILEGFALGIPTIGTRVPGIVDLLQDGWNGFLMDMQERGLLEVLIRIERDPALYAAVCKGAQEQATYLRPTTWAREYQQVYRHHIDALQGIA